MRPLHALLGTLAALAAVVALPSVVAAGGGCHGEPASAVTGSAGVVRMQACTYVPSIDRVPVGTEITFVNATQTPHDVTGARATWRSRILEPGESYARRFSEPGLYPYSCSLHPGMAGVIAVGSADVELASASTPAAPSPGDDVDLASVGAGATGLAFGAIGAALFLRRRAAY